MPMTWAYNVSDADPKEIRATLHRAVELGITLFDTADVYGPYTNEETLAEFIVKEGLREKVQIATKCGLVPLDNFSYGRNGRPDYIKKSCEESLRRLQVDFIDLYQLHRSDPEVPIEETWGAFADLVKAGKVRAIGLSEATLDEVKRANAIHPVASVQSELSIWSNENIDNGVLGYCNENNIGFLAFSPLGRGFLTGELKASEIGKDDFRAANPRFTESAMRGNQVIIDGIAKIAKRLNATAAQLSLAWVLGQGVNVVPIPGTKRRKWLEQNAEAVELTLSEADFLEIAALPSSIAPRY